MIKTYLKNKMLISAILWSVAIIFSILSMFIYHFADQSKSKFEDLLAYFEEKEKNIKADTRLTEDYLDFYKRKQAFKVIRDKDFTRIFDRIKHQLHLQNVKLKLDTDQLVPKTKSIYERRFFITVSLDTEERFYQLIDRLYNQIPGFIVVEKFSIKPTTDKRYEGKIECLWVRKK